MGGQRFGHLFEQGHSVLMLPPLNHPQAQGDQLCNQGVMFLFSRHPVRAQSAVQVKLLVRPELPAAGVPDVAVRIDHVRIGRTAEQVTVKRPERRWIVVQIPLFRLMVVFEIRIEEGTHVAQTLFQWPGI